MLNKTLTLYDGRQLGYALYGPADGTPVLYFHGTPSSRLEVLMTTLCGVDLYQLLHQHQLRLIAIDRPGMGLSTLHPGRTVLSFAYDVQELMEQLRIEEAKVMAWSGGGPYALALCSVMPEKIKGAFIIAGFSSSFCQPMVFDALRRTRLYFRTAQAVPQVLKTAMRLVVRRKLRKPLSQKLLDLPDADYVYFKDPQWVEKFSSLTLKEACRYSPEGAVQEAALYFQPFGFDLAGIQVPVHFWWGSDDRAVPYIHAKMMESILPQVTPHYSLGEGHISIYMTCFAEVLALAAKDAVVSHSFA